MKSSLFSGRHIEIESSKKKRFTTIVVSLCAVVVFCTICAGLWNNGSLLPSWVQWRTFAVRTDVNGNDHIETIKLTNRHLTITDNTGSHYVTPDDWLIMDAQFGDVTGDGTPEILMLTWQQDSKNNRDSYRLPLFVASEGFSQYLHVFDYTNGEIDNVWVSKPLTLQVKEIFLTKNGQLSLELESGTITNWVWHNPGFLLQDDDMPESMFTLIQ